MSIPSVGPTWYSHWAGITSALVPDTLTEIHFKNASRQPLPITNTATHYLCLVPQHTCHFRHNCGNNGYKQSLDKCLKDLQGLKETNATTNTCLVWSVPDASVQAGSVVSLNDVPAVDVAGADSAVVGAL